MSWNTDGALQRRVALVVIAALAVNPSMMVAAGPPEAAASAAVARVGSIMVESEPAGAAVYVDGQMTGQTPLQVLGLSAGDHRVRLVKGGYLENARLVSVGGAPGTVRVKLTRDAGSRPELAAQLGGGGGATGGGGGRSKLPLYLALAGGGAVAAVLLLKKDSSPAGHAPTIGSFTASPTTGIMATVTTFTAVNAADEDGDALSFAWDFGDGGTGTGASATHTYATAGTFTVKVTVTAGSDSASVTSSLVVRNLTGTWSGPLVCCGGQTLNSVVTLTQSGTNLTGTYTDQFVGDAGNVVGSVNATTRQVTFTNTMTSSGGQFSFTGTPNAAALSMPGLGNNVSGTAVGPNSPWTITRP